MKYRIFTIALADGTERRIQVGTRIRTWHGNFHGYQVEIFPAKGDVGFFCGKPWYGNETKFERRTARWKDARYCLFSIQAAFVSLQKLVRDHGWAVDQMDWDEGDEIFGAWNSEMPSLGLRNATTGTVYETAESGISWPKMDTWLQSQI